MILTKGFVRIRVTVCAARERISLRNQVILPLARDVRLRKCLLKCAAAVPDRCATSCEYVCAYRHCCKLRAFVAFPWRCV